MSGVAILPQFSTGASQLDAYAQAHGAFPLFALGHLVDNAKEAGATHVTISAWNRDDSVMVRDCMATRRTSLRLQLATSRALLQIIDSLCDECMKSQYDDNLSEYLKQQMFDYTMALIEFWHHELIDRGIYLEDF